MPERTDVLDYHSVQARPRWFAWIRVCVLWLILWSAGMLVVCGLSSLVKLAAYEMKGVDEVRALVGQEVTLRHTSRARAYQGTLTSASYRFNDKWGFFDLCVSIDASQGGIITGLEPDDLKRISKVTPPGN